MFENEEISPHLPPAPDPDDDLCPICDGTGDNYGHLCKQCGGTGYVKR